MFESILNNILQKYLGKYVSGLDSNNLRIGVWSGNVDISNISLRENVLDILELPIALKYGHIGKLSITVPWNRLSSSPVIVSLDSMYMVVHPIKREHWQFVDFKSFNKKLEMAEAYAEEVLKKLIKK